MRTACARSHDIVQVVPVPCHTDTTTSVVVDNSTTAVSANVPPLYPTPLVVPYTELSDFLFIITLQGVLTAVVKSPIVTIIHTPAESVICLAFVSVPLGMLFVIVVPLTICPTWDTDYR